MDFKLTEDTAGCREGFLALLGDRGYRCEGGTAVRLIREEGGVIRIEYRDGCAVITASEKAFLFRGLMTLVMRLEQKGAEDSFVFEEAVQFARNGCMVDCSRNCVMNLEAAKAWMRMQAAVGMNTMMLYTEDTYEVPGYPYFGALRGRYKKEELQELDAYAAMLGIELIPCIQALGHLQQPLRWPAMQQLRDTSDILMVGEEQVYAFVRACIRQVSSCFRTRRVHLGMDEAWTLGLGQYLIRNGYTPKREIIRCHMERVMELCREEGLEPMIWSDMYFRVHSENEDYYDVPFDADMESGERPPEGMALVYWDYYHMDENFYRNYLRMHRDLTDQVIFAGGGWTWNGMAPDLEAAWAVTVPALDACRREGIQEVIYTLWGDDGTETPVFSALGPVLLCAEYGFGARPDEARVREKFEFLTGHAYDTYCELGAFDIMTEELTDQNLEVNPSKGLFFQDLMLGIYDGQLEGTRCGAYYAELEKRLGGRREHGPGFLADELERIMEYYRAFASALAKKADLGLNIAEAYQKKDLDVLQKIAEKEIPETAAGIERCRRLREDLWKREGKITGWEILDIRYRALTGRMQSASERILDYVEGRTADLPELEEARLPLFPEASGEKRMQGGYRSWINLVSASPLAWSWMPQ